LRCLRALTAKANAAAAVYRKAQAELAVATSLAMAAAKHAAETAEAVSEAHKTIGRLASNAYIMGGSMSDIQPLLSANGPQDLIDQLSTLSTLGAQNSVALAQFKEAEAAARKAKAAADTAKAVQQVATDKVAATKKIADDAKAEQAKEVAKLQKVQDELMRQLMSARKVRTTLEQQQHLEQLKHSVTRLLHLLRHKFLHVSHTFGDLKDQTLSIAQDLFTLHIKQLDLVGQTGIASIQLYILGIPSMFR